MKAKDFLKATITNFIPVEAIGMINYDKENDGKISSYFPIDDDCEISDGEYIYIYLDDIYDLGCAEKYLRNFGLNNFQYNFPLNDSQCFVAFIKIDD